MEFTQKLYKIDTKGKTRVLHIHTKGSDLIQESGIVDGKLITHTKTCNGKNIGRTNETTPEEQAKSEAASKVTESLKSEYFTTIEEAKGDDVILPMLAKDYKKEFKKIDWTTAYIQPKLDGMRCLAFVKDGKCTLVSRTGTLIDTVPHIVDVILANVTKGLEYIFDGELYAHGLNFQENMRLIKKVRPGETNKIVYHIYDVVENSPYSDRQTNIADFVDRCNSSIINLVSTFKASSEKDMKDFHIVNLKAGYEGTIIRHGNVGYQVNKRSSYLLKYKDFIDIALPVIDIIPAESRPDWASPIFELKGVKFGAGMKFSHNERIDILKNKKDYIGKTAEIRFFEYSENGIPRFPVVVGFRLDK